MTRDSDTKVTKLRKISNDLLAFDFKGELLEVEEENVDFRSVVKLERRSNRLLMAKEREEETYRVEEEYEDSS